MRICSEDPGKFPGLTLFLAILIF